MSDPYDVVAFDPAAWINHAACIGVDAELFFPTRGESSEPAKAVCRACPVRQECLDHAMTRPERFGVWGGCSERERRNMRTGRPVSGRGPGRPPSTLRVVVS